MEAGLVLAKSRRSIGPAMTAGALHDFLAADGAPLVESVLHAAAIGAPRSQPQDERLATRAPKLSKADGWVDFAAPADECRRRINGLSPWPGVTVQFRGQPLRLLRATTELKEPRVSTPAPGTIVAVPEGLIACGDGALLRLLQVQPAGKRIMPWRDFANGHALKSEEVLAGGKPSC